MLPSANEIIQAGGLVAIALIIFAESGLLLGLLLPGDTLLIAGGIFASEHKLPLLPLLIVVAVATILGYQLGYVIGQRAGPHIFRHKEGALFRQDYIAYTENFLKRHGWKTVLIARFIAIVRTVVPLVAGMGHMNKRAFLVFNILGGVVWSGGLILLSYWIGQKVPNLDSYIKYFVLLAILLTFGSVFYELARYPNKRREIFTALKEEYKFIFKR